MTRLTESIAPNSGSPLTGVPVADDRSAANTVRDGLASRQVCPFCGSQNPISGNSNTNSNGPCPRCTMEDTAATRQATKARIGPWHVLQTRNPAAPGMRYATLLALVGKGQVTARSVIRGPTTHQLWRYAAHVKGLSREFGVCYSCGESVGKTAAHCPHCDRAQEPIGNPDALLESRELAAVAAPANSNFADDAAAHDPYPIVTRHPPGQQIPSIAERLRMGNEVRRRPDGRALSALELAAALQIAPPPSPPAGHPVRTILITLSVVSVLAAGIIGYARPDLRRQAQNWLQTASASAEQKIRNFHLQKRPPTDQWPPSAQADGATGTSPSGDTPQAAEPSVVLPAPSSTDTNSTLLPHDNSSSPAPPGSVQITVGQGPPAPNTPPADAAPAVAPAQSSEQPPSPPPSPAPQPSLLPDRPVLVKGTLSASEIWALRSRGLDAEGRQDWAEAVRCYQQIEEAPKDLWPTDVKIKLANAQRQLGK